MKPFTNCDGCCDYCPATTCEDRKTEHIQTHTTTQEDINRAKVSYQSLTDEEIKELLRTEYEKGRYDATIENSIPNKWKSAAEEQEKIIKYLKDLGYTITLNGDVISREEELKDMERYIKYQKEKLIEKACDWLLRGGYFINNTETIDDFRKAMEE